MLLQSTQRPVSALHVAELAAGVSHSRRLLGAGGVVLCDVACVNDYLVTVYMKQPHMNKCKYGARLVLWGSRFRASYCMLASVCVCVHATALVVICNNSTAVDSNTLCDKSGFRLGGSTVPLQVCIILRLFKNYCHSSLWGTFTLHPFPVTHPLVKSVTQTPTSQRRTSSQKKRA